MTRFALLRWNLLDRGHSARWSPNLSWFHLKNSACTPLVLSHARLGQRHFTGFLKSLSILKARLGPAKTYQLHSPGDASGLVTMNAPLHFPQPFPSLESFPLHRFPCFHFGCIVCPSFAGPHPCIFKNVLDPVTPRNDIHPDQLDSIQQRWALRHLLADMPASQCELVRP